MMDLRSGDASSTVRLWSFGEDTMVEDGDDPRVLTVVTRWGEQEVFGSNARVVESVRRMAYGPVSLRNTLRHDDTVLLTDVEELESIIDRLGGAVRHSLGLPDGQAPLLTAVPVSATAVLHPRPVAPDLPVRLSRFASMRPIADGMVLERPVAPFTVQLSLPLGPAVVGALAVPTTAAELATTVGLPAPVAEDVVTFLAAAGQLIAIDLTADDPAPDETRAVRGWAHHELQFHVRSRAEGRDRPLPEVDGDAVSEPAPIVRPVPPGRRFPLPVPDPADVGPPLGRLLERDHSCPTVSGAAVTVQQIGELLHRSARIRSVGPAYIPGPGISHEASQRPYLSTACLYELELYLTLDRCEGLPRGVFHYDPLDHCLTLVQDGPEAVGELLDIGRIGCGSMRRPAAVATVTARLDRLSWVFAGNSYAVALKHCGVLQAVLYLVGAAMGLAVHAVPAAGGRRSDDLAGGPWPGEVAVGESVLEPLAQDAPEGVS